MVKLFYSYAHEDEALRNKLEAHLATLRNGGYITNWHDRKIVPGDKWDHKISSELSSADIVLLLISSDFINSNYCLGVEAKRAIELNDEGKLIVIPVILRFCDWSLPQLQHLQCLPRDGHPVTSREYWESEDRAFWDIAEGIKDTVHRIREGQQVEVMPKLQQKLNFSVGGFEYQIGRYLLEHHTFVGIDFGTSTTVVSVIQLSDGHLDVVTVPFEYDNPMYGKQKTAIWPSAIYYDVHQDKLYTGVEAKMRKYAPDTRPGINYWTSFKMGLGTDAGSVFTESLLGDPSGTIQIRNNQDACKEFLRTVRDRIGLYIKEQKLSEDVKLSFSIPASFEANQRRELLAVISAIGYEAHEDVFIDEPNAAFLNYLLEAQRTHPEQFDNQERQHTLVFDFGAGTCDISILEFGRKIRSFYSRNIAISKFEQLGGDDIDKEIARKVLFPEFCELYDLDPDSISDREYETFFESKLRFPAETLKIKMNNKLKSLQNGQIPAFFITCEEPIVFSYQGKEFNYDSQSMKFKQFSQVMEPFMVDAPGNEETIFYVINSALAKAKMERTDIDNVLMIGGSCKSPLIEQSLRDKFPQAKFLIPTDLQAQVARGAALNALLALGLNKPPIAPIVSEAISIKLSDGKYQNLIQQGEEIPHFKAITNELMVQRDGQTEIELPLFVSGETKMLQKVIVRSEKGFSKGDNIELSAEIDKNKIVTIKVICNNKYLTAHHFSPFEGEVLSPYTRVVKETEKEINNLLSGGLAPGDKKINSLAESLILYHSKMNNFKEAMETAIKFFPDHYADISYYADFAGYDKISKKYAIRAFEANPNETTAYNIALSYDDQTAEYDKYINIASDLGSLPAKIAIAIKTFEVDEYSARQMMQQPFQELFDQYQRNRLDMPVSEIDDLLQIAVRLGYESLAKDLAEFLRERSAAEAITHKLFEESNLLKRKS